MNPVAHPGHNIQIGYGPTPGMNIDTNCHCDQLLRNSGWGYTALYAPPGLALRAACKPIDLTIEQLNILWQMDKRTVDNLAIDPSTPAALLDRLATHPAADVRGAVCDNESTPIDTLWALAKDTDPHVRYQLADNHNLPLALISSLTNDENPYVAYRALKTYNRLKAH